MSSPAARARRLKIARLMAGLTRKCLEKQYGVSASTIQSWETAKISGLAERQVHRIIPTLRQQGIFCTSDWLLYGIGNAPQLARIAHQRREDDPTIPNLTEDKIIIQELLTFRNLNANVIDFIVCDNGMEPQFHQHDYVGGCRRTKENIAELLGMNCIVETAHNEIFLRRLKPGSHSNLYTLICNNSNTTISAPTLYDQNLLSAAPVIWHRRHEPS